MGITTHRKKPTKGNWVKFALFFGIVFCILVFISFAFKIGKIIQESHFDGTHQINVLVKDPQGSSLVSFNPDTSSISILPSFSQGLPVDGEMSIRESLKNLKDILYQSLFHGKGTLTKLDLLRLFIFSQGVTSGNVTTASTITHAFFDHTLFQEGKSVAVVNATEVSGLGNTVAHLLTNMGADVISITSSATNQKNSTLFYVGNLSYTAHRLSEALHIPAMQSTEQGISDITIVIGEDKISSF